MDTRGPEAAENLSGWPPVTATTRAEVSEGWGGRGDIYNRPPQPDESDELRMLPEPPTETAAFM